jgi:hypothetical protein
VPIDVSVVGDGGVGAQYRRRQAGDIAGDVGRPDAQDAGPGGRLVWVRTQEADQLLRVAAGFPQGPAVQARRGAGKGAAAASQQLEPRLVGADRRHERVGACRPHWLEGHGGRRGRGGQDERGHRAGQHQHYGRQDPDDRLAREPAVFTTGAGAPGTVGPGQAGVMARVGTAGRGRAERGCFAAAGHYRWCGRGWFRPSRRRRKP